MRAGVPNLLPDGLRESSEAGAADKFEISEKQHEITARDAQVEHYDKMPGLKYLSRKELPLSLSFVAPSSDSLMLEGGCGTGRMTALFAENTRGLIAMDFSGESIRVAQTKIPEHLRERVLFIQADLSRLPLIDGGFDRVGSFGVYQHIPTPAARANAMSEMARVLKSPDDGGRFAYSAYRWGMPQIFCSRREGHHGGGIYYRRYTELEFKAEAEKAFQVDEYTDKLSYYHLLSARKRG